MNNIYEQYIDFIEKATFCKNIKENHKYTKKVLSLEEIILQSDDRVNFIRSLMQEQKLVLQYSGACLAIKCNYDLDQARQIIIKVANSDQWPLNADAALIKDIYLDISFPLIWKDYFSFVSETNELFKKFIFAEVFECCEKFKKNISHPKEFIEFLLRQNGAIELFFGCKFALDEKYMQDKAVNIIKKYINSKNSFGDKVIITFTALLDYYKISY